MAKSNWKGTSGWGTIVDPTGVLNGKVLVATGGESASAEDYVSTDIGTSNPFTLVHYSVRANYAFNTGSMSDHPMRKGHFSLIARATTFTGDPSLANNCYLGRIDMLNKCCKIVRRFNNVEKELIRVGLNDTALARGVLHSLELRCYDTQVVTLQLIVNGETVATVGDSDAEKKLTSGISGIESYNGTVYMDNYAIYQYTSTGEAPASWTPTEIGGETGIVVWWIKADAGISKVADATANVFQWNDQSGLGSNLSIDSAADRPTFLDNAQNNLPGIVFTTASKMRTSTDIGSLELNSGGGSVFILMKITDFDETGTPVLSKYSSPNGWNFDLFDSAGKPNSIKAKFAGDTTKYSDNSFTEDVFQILCWVSNKDSSSDTARHAFFIDGVSSGETLGLNPDNTLALTLGSDKFAGTICEIIVCDSETSISDRQKIEGYLAHKWATWNRLPTDHPYYRQGPLV